MAEVTAPPMGFAWDGEAMIPERPRLADRYFVVGQHYSFIEHHERSSASHAHFFVAFKELWNSLPDEWVARWPSPDLWRKHLLIKTGFCDTKSVVCGSNAEALRWAAIVSDSWDLVDIRGRVVTMWRAHSQAYPSMDKERFQASKDAVLEAAAAALEEFHQPEPSAARDTVRSNAPETVG